MSSMKEVSIPSSFVARNLKLVSDTGAGEAKLFVGSARNTAEFNDFFGFGDNYTYWFNKENLIEYLNQIKLEYGFQKINRYKNVSLETWEENYHTICAMNEEDFQIDLRPFTDGSRYYIRSDDDLFKKTFRNLAIPKLTIAEFSKDEKNKAVTIKLRINFNADTLTDISMPVDVESIPSFSIEDLGKILRDMYNNAKASGKVAAIHMFGFKYGSVITEKGYSPKTIISLAGLNDSFSAELSKGINIYRSVHDNEYGVFFHDERETFLSCWNRMIDDVERDGNHLVIDLATTQHTLIWENDRFCDTAYAAPAKQFIDYNVVESVYTGSFVKNPGSGSNMVKYSDSKAVIKLLIEKYGLAEYQNDEQIVEDILSHSVYGIHIKEKHNALSTDDPHVCIGWSKLGDLSSCASKEDIAAKYSEVWPEAKAKSKGQDVGQIYRFVVESQVGDYVVYGDGSVAHIGVIKSDYYYCETPVGQDPDYVNNKKVEWLKDVPYSELSQQFKNSLGSAMSFFRLNDYKSVIFELLRGAYESDSTDNEEFVKENICARAPRANKTNPLNLIIYGAPGTGKTYSTTEYAVATIEGRAVRKSITDEERKALKDQYRALAKNGQIVFTTFHQNYSYEDFIQGLRPDSEKGVLDFVPVDGVFKQLAYTAMHDQVNNYVIIIDEINRGNISKVFGELITLIEEDKRWGEENQLSVVLPSGEEFAVPNNLYIIGTMNSADKSIALIDTALRRRFDFEEVAPNPELIEDETLKKVLTALNALLRKQLDSSDLLIGHAYFIGKSEADLPNILNRNIIPLLYEYFYDQEKKVKDALAKALDGTSVAFDDNSQGRIKVK